MSPTDAFMDLFFLIPFTFVPGLVYLLVATWWGGRRGRGTPRPPLRHVGEPTAGSAVDLTRDDVAP